MYLDFRGIRIMPSVHIVMTHMSYMDEITVRTLSATIGDSQQCSYGRG